MNPPSRAERTSLPLEIHAATRSYHTALNRLITSRLPLCLPPHATNPARYAEGIATLGQIYVVFEEVWDDILTDRMENFRMREVLKQLKVPSLSRSTNLKADLSMLSQRLDGWKPSMEEHGELTHIIDHTRRCLLDRPHLIISYAWIMYMALFNGGRWIREQLNRAGPDFWQARKHTQPCNIDCLSFWDFEGELDGEEIKDTFKARFNTAAAMLNDTERKDVICESIRIFETCSQMVGWLDTQTGVSSPKPITVPEPRSWLAASYTAALSTISGIWSGLVRAMHYVSLQRSELLSPAKTHAS